MSDNFQPNPQTPITSELDTPDFIAFIEDDEAELIEEYWRSRPICW